MGSWPRPRPWLARPPIRPRTAPLGVRVGAGGGGGGGEAHVALEPPGEKKPHRTAPELSRPRTGSTLRRGLRRGQRGDLNSPPAAAPDSARRRQSRACRSREGKGGEEKEGAGVRRANRRGGKGGESGGCGGCVNIDRRTRARAPSLVRRRRPPRDKMSALVGGRRRLGRLRRFPSRGRRERLRLMAKRPSDRRSPGRNPGPQGAFEVSMINVSCNSH